MVGSESRSGGSEPHSGRKPRGAPRAAFIASANKPAAARNAGVLACRLRSAMPPACRIAGVPSAPAGHCGKVPGPLRSRASGRQEALRYTKPGRVHPRCLRGKISAGKRSGGACPFASSRATHAQQHGKVRTNPGVTCSSRGGAWALRRRAGSWVGPAGRGGRPAVPRAGR